MFRTLIGKECLVYFRMDQFKEVVILDFSDEYVLMRPSYDPEEDGIDLFVDWGSTTEMWVHKSVILAISPIEEPSEDFRSREKVDKPQNEVPVLLRRTQVERMTGLGRSMLYMLMQRGEFPKAIKISNRAAAWSKSDVEDWIEKRIKLGKINNE